MEANRKSIDELSQDERFIVECAIGRVFGMMYGKIPADDNEYERCRAIVASIVGF